MRRFVLAVALVGATLGSGLATPSEALACDVYVSGYTRSDGRYVSGHYRSCPNNSTLDNWSTRGNFNPHTGAPGYRDPYPSYSSPSYSPSWGGRRSFGCSYWDC